MNSPKLRITRLCLQRLLLLLLMSIGSGQLSLLAQSHWTHVGSLESINSTGDDFAPAWNPYDSSIVFYSTRSGKSHCYQTDARFSSVREFTQIVPRTAQSSYLSMSRNGEAVFSSFRQLDRQPVLNISASHRTNGVWSEADFVEALKSDNFSAHSSISPSGLTLVFSSEREGSVGGTDLWICTKSGSDWNTPMNIGEHINSNLNEITPFLQSDDTLFFASNGLGGSGGYDLFFCVRVAGEWQPPVPLSDINTAFDESDCCVLPNGEMLFSSNRPGSKGGLDLYRARK